MTIQSDIEILDRLFKESKLPLSAEAAQVFLAVKFSKADRDKMQRLAAKAREGTLTKLERRLAENYERAGHLLAMLKSKARKALKDGRATNKV